MDSRFQTKRWRSTGVCPLGAQVARTEGSNDTPVSSSKTINAFWVSGRGGSHSPALAEPCVNVSAHTAPSVQLSRTCTPPPVGEQVRCAFVDAHQPVPCPSWVAAQPFIFPFGPSHEVLIDASEKWIQPGLVEAAIVVDPALHRAVDQLCQVPKSRPTAQIEPPPSQLLPSRFHGLVARRR